MSYPAQEGRNPLATAHTTPPESTHFASSASIHPAASKIPEPTPAEYDRLKKDISEHGVRIAVVMTDDGRILDGRSRVKACTELGIKCPTRTATPDEMLDPMAASKSLNAHRRHLSADQIDQLLATYITDNALKIRAHLRQRPLLPEEAHRSNTPRPRNGAAELDQSDSHGVPGWIPSEFPCTEVNARPLGQIEMGSAIQTTSTSKVSRVDFGACGPVQLPKSRNR
jgi:hypothetical protein